MPGGLGDLANFSYICYFKKKYPQVLMIALPVSE